jgi:hypothetical protein
VPYLPTRPSTLDQDLESPWKFLGTIIESQRALPG